MARRVVLVTGPPCAGKTTYVRTHAGPDDTILDMDVIAQRLGSTREWMHRRPLSRRADTAMKQGMLVTATMKSGTAWVIRCAPSAAERRWIASFIRADSVILLLPPREVLATRASQRPHPERTSSAIRQWFARYGACDRDEVIT